jgi:PAS domain S-box-containing protein
VTTARGQEAAGDGADRRGPADTLRDELKASRKDLGRFFELSLDMLCVAGTDGYFKTVNPSFCRVLGYAREELLSRPFLDFVHPDDREATVKEINKLSSGRPTFLFENRYRRKDGSYRWFEWMSMPVPEEKIVYAIARDITEHKTMDRRLRTIVESAPVAMILVDPQDRIQLANRMMLEISGYEGDELIGRPAEILIPRSFRQEYALARRKLMAGEKSLRFGAGGNLIALRKGGVEFPVEVVLSSVDLGGPHLLCAVTDITERKKAMERVRKIVEFSPDGILLVDAAGSIRLMNGAAERMFGALRKELLGRPLECLLPERFRHGHSHHRDTFLTEGREPR